MKKADRVLTIYALSKLLVCTGSSNLAVDHSERAARILLWSKLFACRDNFTVLGWQYRNRAVLMLFGLLAILCLRALLGFR